jgi:septum formation protein
MHALILASASPRRRDLLRAAGLEFEVVPADVDETLAGAPSPEEAARELALRKAKHALRRATGKTGWLVAADTVVGLPPADSAGPDSAWRLLGKPADARAAAGMLRALSASRHHVVTGVAVARRRAGEPHDEIRVEVETTIVTMRALSAAEVAAYVASGEWRDKAGGYAIQETGDRFVTRLEGGGLDNVVGLPVARTLRLLERMGWSRDAVADDLGGG